MTIKARWYAFWAKVQPTLEALDQVTEYDPTEEVRRRLLAVEERLLILEQERARSSAHV